jgi:hypothetical protein
MKIPFRKPAPPESLPLSDRAPGEEHYKTLVREYHAMLNHIANIILLYDKEDADNPTAVLGAIQLVYRDAAERNVIMVDPLNEARIDRVLPAS